VSNKKWEAEDLDMKLEAKLEKQHRIIVQRLKSALPNFSVEHFEQELSAFVRMLSPEVSTPYRDRRIVARAIIEMLELIEKLLAMGEPYDQEFDHYGSIKKDPKRIIH
jgi:predicted transcriptional regulator